MLDLRTVAALLQNQTTGWTSKMARPISEQQAEQWFVVLEGGSVAQAFPSREDAATAARQVAANTPNVGVYVYRGTHRITFRAQPKPVVDSAVF